LRKRKGHGGGFFIERKINWFRPWRKEEEVQAREVLQKLRGGFPVRVRMEGGRDLVKRLDWIVVFRNGEEDVVGQRSESWSV